MLLVLHKSANGNDLDGDGDTGRSRLRHDSGMTGPAEDLITVIVPAYNAQATLDETLHSVCAQTHRALEVIVADDGSTDTTAEIVAHHARADPRVRLLRQANTGVAAARNAAIAAARGEFIAPIDADDLWHPAKLEKQLAAMRRGGERVGLVYVWSAFIDLDSRIVGLMEQNFDEGLVLARLCHGNFVGNGSAPLMRSAAVRQAGGYDTSLLRREAEGCEDFALYLAIAEHYEYVLVPEYLTGYRQRPDSMSSDSPQMCRSFDLVTSALMARRPDLRFHLQNGKANSLLGTYRRLKAAGDGERARPYLLRFVWAMPYHAVKAFLYRPIRNAFLHSLTGRSSATQQSAWIGRRFPHFT